MCSDSTTRWVTRQFLFHWKGTKQISERKKAQLAGARDRGLYLRRVKQKEKLWLTFISQVCLRSAMNSVQLCSRCRQILTAIETGIIMAIQIIWQAAKRLGFKIVNSDHPQPVEVREARGHRRVVGAAVGSK